MYLFSLLLDYIIFTVLIFHGFEYDIKPLCRHQRLYHRQSFPLLVWSPTLIDLFQNYKTILITSPLLLRYDSSKPTLLKIDWSVGGTEYGYTLTVY